MFCCALRWEHSTRANIKIKWGTRQFNALPWFRADYRQHGNNPRNVRIVDNTDISMSMSDSPQYRQLRITYGLHLNN